MKGLRRFAIVAVVLVLAAPAGAQQSGSQGPSVAEAARKARQQKAGQAKAKAVFTNDNLPTTGAVSYVGNPDAYAKGGSEASSGDKAAKGTSAAAGSEEDRAKTEGEIEQAKKELEVLKKDLELLKRDYELQRQQFFSNPGYAGDSAGKVALDGLENQVTTKQQEVAQAQQKLQELEAKLKELGETLGPKKEEPPTEDQTRDQWRARLQPLRNELANVERELARIRAEAANAGGGVYGATPSSMGSGSFTADRIAQLEQRRQELLQQISAVEDEARRAGIPVGAIR